MATISVFGALGILLVLFIATEVRAQDRSRSRYIPPPQDEEESIDEEKVPEVTSISRRLPTSARNRLKYTSPDANERRRFTKETYQRESNRQPLTIDGHLPNPRTESRRQQVDSRPSIPQSPQYHESSWEEPSEHSTDPPPVSQQDKKKRQKKRRRPRPETKIEDSEDLPNHEDSDKLRESAHLANDRSQTSFSNSKLPSHPLENNPPREPSSPPHSPPLNIRDKEVRPVSIRGRSQPIDDTKSQTTNKNPIQESKDSRSSRRHSFRSQQSRNRLSNQETIRNLDRDHNDKKSEVIPDPDFSSEHLNSPAKSDLYNQNYRPLDSIDGGHLPYQPTDGDRLPKNDNLPEHISEIHLPPPGEPFDVSEFAQPGVDYSDLPQEPELKLPLNPSGRDSTGQHPKYPVPTNRLPEPSEVNYKPVEQSDEHAPFLHSTEDQQTDFEDRPSPLDNARRSANPLSTENQRQVAHSRDEQNLSPSPQRGSAQQQGRILAVPRHTVSAQSRVGSRYEPDNQDDENLGQSRRVNPNRSGPDPKLQNVASRYLQSRRYLNEKKTTEEKSPITESRTDNAPLQRAGSRYQPESLETARYNPSRDNPSLLPEETAPAAIEPPRQRTIPRSQRRRSRFPEEPEIAVTEPIPEEPQRRVPAQRIQRTRTRYQPENDIQPDPPAQGDRIRTDVVRNAPPRTVPRRDRTGPRTQSRPEEPPLPVNEVPADQNQPQGLHRSRPQFESNSRRKPAEENVQSVFSHPDYQQVTRSSQRQPNPRPAGPQQQVITRQRSTSRQHRPKAPVNRPHSDEPTAGRSRGSNFECPDDYGFFPDPQQCDKYYECHNGTAEEGLCSDGLVFNLISAPTYVRCDSIRDIDCSTRPGLQEPQSTKHCPRRFGLFPHEKECTKFWNCVDGSSTIVQCPPGLVYDDALGTCNWADLVKDSCATEDLLGFTCPEATPAQLQEGVYVRYAHPENCQLHFTCIKGTDGQRRPRMLSCNDGLVFDPETGQCTWPENVPGCEEYYGKPVKAQAKQQATEPPQQEEQPARAQGRRRRPTQTRTRS